MTDEHSTQIKHRERQRWYCALKMIGHGVLVYVTLAYGPVPHAFAWPVMPPAFLVILFGFFAAFGYVGMATWQYQKPNDEALTAEDLAE